MDKDPVSPLKPADSMPMWFYDRSREFRYPIPTDFEFAYIDKTGKIQIVGPFNVAYDFHNGVSVVSFGAYAIEDGKWIATFDQTHMKNAILSADGSFVAPKDCIPESQFYDPELSVCRVGPVPVDGSWESFYELMDKSGRVVTNNKWKEAGDYSEGLAVVQTRPGSPAGYSDKSGKMVIEYKFEEANRFSEGLAAVVANRVMPLIGKRAYSYIGKTGEVAIPGPFEEARAFHSGLAAVKVKEKWGYIDNTGKLVVPYQFDWAGDFIGKFAPVEKDELVGFIDRSGKTVIPLQFKDAKEFSGGLAPATLDAKNWGYINESGEFAIPPSFRRAFPFSGDLALVYIPTRKEINIGPTELPFAYASALSKREQDDFNQARKICLQIQQVDSKSIWAQKAKVLLDCRLPDHELAPNVVQTYAEAVRFLHTKQPEAAAKKYKECLALDPEFNTVAGALAFVYLQEKKPDEVIDLLKPEVSKRPKYARGWWRLSEAYELKGQSDMARECAEKAKQLDPDDPWFHR